MLAGKIFLFKNFNETLLFILLGIFLILGAI